MRLAIIIQGPGYINPLCSLGIYLKSKGIEIIYVLENKYEIYKQGYQKFFEKEQVYFLIDFRKRSKNSISKQKYDWLPLFSTFDRVTTYGYKVTTDDFNEMLITEYNMWDSLFRGEELDGVIGENVSETMSYVAYLKCLQYKKKYLGIITSALPGRLCIVNDLYNTDKVSQLFHTCLKEGKKTFDSGLVNLYRQITSPAVSPDYMKNNPTSVDYSLMNHYLRKSHLIKKYVYYYLKEHGNITRSFETKGPFWMAWRLFIRQARRKVMVKVMTAGRYCTKPDYNEKFLIYPLHFHPEASTLINAWPFIDELPVIRNIAFSLPDGYKLYVKPHPNGFGYEGVRFYKRIRAIPRVRLIHYSLNPKELIASSSGVITLTSTMGFEALMIEKPVFIFGNIFYQAHPYCHKIENMYLLPEVLAKGLNKEYNQQMFERYSLLLLKACLDCSFPGKFEFCEKQDAKNISRIGDEIVKSISSQM